MAERFNSAEPFGSRETCDLAVGKHILVVEDDPIIVELIQDIVVSMGYGVVVADNARDALTQYADRSGEAACVILDYGIPGMDPSRLLSRMREINVNVKVIVSSGYSQNFIRQDFPLESVSGFIPKPYEPRKLVEELHRVVAE